MVWQSRAISQSGFPILEKLVELDFAECGYPSM